MTLQLTDEEIIFQLLPTQPAYCFELLYRRYVHKVYQRCLSMMHDPEKARDLTQDIFMRVFDQLEKFRHHARFSTWLYSITFNYCSDHLRHSKRFPQLSIDSTMYLPIHDTDETWLYEMKLTSIQQGLEKLSTADQLLLRQKYEQDMSIRELSKLYGIGESAIKMRLKRSRNKLQAAYNQFSRA